MPRLGLSRARLQFVTIMLVESEPNAADAIASDFRKLNKGKDVTVGIQPTQPWHNDDESPRCKEGVQFTGHLRVTGPDAPGMLERITRLLGELELDITSISCNQHVQASGPAGAQPRMRCDACVAVM